MINFVKKMFVLFCTITVPWLVLFFHDNPGGALIALIMQATIIGWPFASMWAWRVHYSPKKKKEDESDEEIT